ncbi:MAG: SusC/RagA family TonB-linked outer membrane protein [Marinoscillum sp.]
MKNNLLKGILAMSKILFQIFFLQALFVTFLHAEDSSAQNRSLYEIKVSIQVKDVPVTDIFKELEEKTGFLFTYNDVSIDNTRVTINRRNRSIGTILEDLSGLTDLRFKRINDNIHVNKGISRNQSIEEKYDVKQEFTVSGTVQDEDGEVLPGVSILVKGSSVGTVSDVDGNYKIAAGEGDILVFSFVGFVPQEIPVRGQLTIDVSLEYDVQSLTEVVVTGYTSQRKADITGAVAVLDMDDLQKVKTSSIAQKLDGRASGLITSTSGEPGTGTNVRIRGFSSFTNNEPLWVIDGVQSTDKGLTWLNPNDIESIQVLKDAAAASIYGSRASNGVIVVTTKKGQKGKIKVSYDAYYGVTNPIAGYDDIMITDPYDLAEAYSQYWGNSSTPMTADNYYYQYTQDGTLPDYMYPIGNDGDIDESTYSWPDNLIMRANKDGTNWWDETTNPGYQTEHTVSVSGGGANSSFAISANHFDQKGTIIYTNFKRTTIRANSQFDAGIFSMGENLAVSRSSRVGAAGNNNDNENQITAAMLLHPTVPIYDISGQYFAGGKSTGFGNRSNPVARLYQNKDNVTTNNKVFGNVFAELNFTDFLKARTSLGFDYSNSVFVGFDFPNPEDQEPNNADGVSETWNQNFLWQWTNTLEFDKTFGQHQVKALLGYEAVENNFRQIQGNVNSYFTYDPSVWYLNTGIGDPGSRGVNSFGGPWTLASLFAKVDYIFADKYLFGATVRRDGSSKFGPNNRYGVFPATSVGWRLSEEAFLSGVSFLSDLKLRASYGVTGNQNIPSSNAFFRFGGGPTSSFYDINGSNNGLATGYALTAKGNPDVKWERNISYNYGFDASLLDYRLNIVLDYYVRQVDGLLFKPVQPGTAGSADVPFYNIGKMENKGIDLNIDYKGRVNDLNYNIGVIVSHYKNKIVNISDDAEEFYDTSSDLPGQTIIHQEGQPVGMFYGLNYLGVIQDPASAPTQPGGQFAGGWLFEDVDGSGSIDSDTDRKMIGNPHPDVTLGLNLGFEYKNFDMNAFFFASIGNDIYNYHKYYYETGRWSSNFSKRVLTDTWTEDRTNAELPMLSADNNTSAGFASSYYIEDGSYVRLRTLQIGYNLPSNILEDLGLGNARIYIQGQNLFTLTGYSGIDPALSNVDTSGGESDNTIDLALGVDLGNYPASRILSAGINVTF